MLAIECNGSKQLIIGCYAVLSYELIGLSAYYVSMMLLSAIPARCVKITNS
jgi:hypothetical protein